MQTSGALFIAVVLLMVFDQTNQVNGFTTKSRCNKVCFDDQQCRDGQCVLISCDDTAMCLNYCFNCYGKEICKSMGQESCRYATRSGLHGLSFNIAIKPGHLKIYKYLALIFTIIYFKF